MEGFALLRYGFVELFSSPETFIYLIVGVLGGMIFGAIPGLTGALGVSLMLPFTFSMQPSQGLATLIAIYVGGISGGLVSSILINIPGTPASMVTTFDGAPMAKKGKPNLALSYGITSSLIGGLFSGIVLVFIAPKLATVALSFGPWEYFALGLLGLSVVVSLTSKDPVKGFMGCIIGMILSMIGYDALTSSERLTFGFWQLGAGLDDLAAIMGLFALPEILSKINRLGEKGEQIEVEKASVFPTFKMFKGMGKVLSLSSIIGTIIGIMPGVGSATASLIAYNQARNISKTPEKFGTGHAEGIVASEAANNAVCGGAIIPMLTLGVPGDLVTAIMLGGMIVHGLVPGPQLFQQNQDVIGTIYVAYILACIIMFVLFIFMMRMFIKVVTIPTTYLIPMILLMCMIGTITANNRVFDAWVFYVIGIIGYLLINSGISLAPITLGFVLGGIVETNFRRAVIAFDGNILSLFTKPIAACLMILAILFMVVPIIKNWRQSRKMSKEN